MAQTDTKYYALGGGLDVVTPALSVPPGRLLTCVNFEPWFSGGYRRIDGFERFDGRPRPHLQTFTAFDVSAVEDVTLGATVTGGTSGATGVVVGKYVDDGTYGSDVLAVTKLGGTQPFVNGESLGVTSTGATALHKPNAAVVDTGANLLSGAFTDIDEGTDFAESVTGLYTNEQTPALRSVLGAWAAGTIDIPLLNLDAGATTVTAWTMTVRARVTRRGPETDDTVTYRFTFAPTGDSQVIDFTAGDVGAGWITRTVTQAVSATSVANFNAASIVLAQQAFTQNGYGDDQLGLEVDCVQVESTFNAPVTLRSAPIAGYAPNQDTEDTFKAATFDLYRTDILKVPGEGNVLGAWRRNSDTFAIRNNVGSTEGILHLASSAGWTTTGVTMSKYIYYDAGTDGAFPAWITEGVTVNGQTSGATAVVHRVVLQAGAPGTNDASGYLVFAAVTGGPFVNNENIRIGVVVVAVVNGAQATFAFPAGGVYQFTNHNFFGSSSTFNVYGCNGVGPAFEISEGNVVSPILFPATALAEQPANNTPFLIEEHRNYLFLAFPGGRIVATELGEPLSLNGFLGAAEFGVGAEITGLKSVTGGVLAITTQSQTRGLFGAIVADWELKILGERTGGALYSTQLLDTVYGLDDLGITSLSRIQSYGDFSGATISQLVQPIIDALRSTLNDATVVRKYNQYRLYFSGNEVLINYVPAPGASSASGSASDSGAQFGFASYPFPVKHIWNTDDETGAERTFFVTSDSDLNDDGFANNGYVYEDLVGTSFDGQIIRSYLRLPFNFLNSAALRKHFRRADIELSSLKPLELKFIADLTYGSPEISSSISDLVVGDIPQIDVFAGGGFWDTDNWDDFFWDGQNLSAARANLDGTGENIGFLIYNESTVSAPFIIQGLTLHYDRRRLQR